MDDGKLAEFLRRKVQEQRMDYFRACEDAHVFHVEGDIDFGDLAKQVLTAVEGEF